MPCSGRPRRDKEPIPQVQGAPEEQGAAGSSEQITDEKMAPERQEQEVERGGAQTEGHRAWWDGSRWGLLQGWRVHSREEGVEGSKWRSDVLWLSCEQDGSGGGL